MDEDIISLREDLEKPLERKVLTAPIILKCKH